LDTHGNVFGGFTPLEWQSPPGEKWKCDDSLKSVLFTLNNPHNIVARKFTLEANLKQYAISCHSGCGPSFDRSSYGLHVFNNCNANPDSYTYLDGRYDNDTGLDWHTVFTGSKNFQVREIEVFEIAG
jgi:hypothetical protein